MFEKQAEENGFGLGCTVNSTIAWQKGAEFGYNKGKEEANEKLYKAKEIISKLYSAGRDVLICLAELDEDIKQAEQFLKE